MPQIIQMNLLRIFTLSLGVLIVSGAWFLGPDIYSEYKGSKQVCELVLSNGKTNDKGTRIYWELKYCFEPDLCTRKFTGYTDTSFTREKIVQELGARITCYRYYNHKYEPKIYLSTHIKNTLTKNIGVTLLFACIWAIGLGIMLFCLIFIGEECIKVCRGRITYRQFWLKITKPDFAFK